MAESTPRSHGRVHTSHIPSSLCKTSVLSRVCHKALPLNTSYYGKPRHQGNPQHIHPIPKSRPHLSNVHPPVSSPGTPQDIIEDTPILSMRQSKSESSSDSVLWKPAPPLRMAFGGSYAFGRCAGHS
mmetsp:Transcript_5039/g.13691  ORF Transcript_5039/g.13691 Transcript_5039/m.13691 type:complete len:127 (-) Transcript_5039:739-1119(-)